MKYKKGFTLIELLVVIAIIGILSSIVLASLNSARAKGQLASIKSNLKNMLTQTELGYDTTGSYANACASVSSMVTAINNSGGTAVCYSYDNTRWGVSAKLNSDTTKNYSVDPAGMVTWDAADVATGNYVTANANCVAAGGRLPSVEEMKALSLAYSSTNPPIFSAANWYWSSTAVPGSPGNAYIVYMANGNVMVNGTAAVWYARCVR